MKSIEDLWDDNDEKPEIFSQAEATIDYVALNKKKQEIANRIEKGELNEVAEEKNEYTLEDLKEVIEVKDYNSMTDLERRLFSRSKRFDNV
jgi:flagellar hook assembly protein FlgD